MEPHVGSPHSLYHYLMLLLLWVATEGSRDVAITQDFHYRDHHPNRISEFYRFLNSDESYLEVFRRYDLEYSEDNFHNLGKVRTRKRNLLNDYQNSDYSDIEEVLYKERSRAERKGDGFTRYGRGGGQINESQALELTGGTILKMAPPAHLNVEEPAGADDDNDDDDEVAPATEKTGKGEITEGEDISIRHIVSAEDLQMAGRPLCRSRENFLPPELFSADSCALCYGYLQNQDFFQTKWLPMELLRMLAERGRTYAYKITVLFNPTNESQVEAAVTTSEVLLNTFRGDVGRAKWRSCCEAAVQCCHYMLTSSWPPGSCPNTWDGWQCWQATSPDTEIKRPCPSYIYHGKEPSCAKEASKRCDEAGHWYRREGRHEWSNYSSCSVEQNIHRRLYVHIAAYSISVAALFPALCIFFSYKQLRVHRITLHKHLFLSLLLEALGVIIFRLLQLYKNDLIQQNPPWCVTLNLLTKYTSLSNYMWYLCEGFYLHKLLVSAFAEQNNLLIFYLIGWGFPLVPLTIYSVIRGQGDHNTHCWIVPVEGLDWIINLPPLLAILINVIFVVNIIRILVSKVRATTANEPSQYRKAVRATMMVVPLFGLQYIITIYRHQVLGCDWQDLYQIFNNMIEGTTGAVVAIIFCYTNGEVKALLKRTWERLQERRTPRGVRGPKALHSRSFSTVQTTLLDPSPATRRNSSIVSICVSNQPFRRTSSGANASQLLSLHGSRSSIAHPSPVDSGRATTSLMSPRLVASAYGLESSERFGSSKSPVHNLDSSPIARSLSLFEEVEDETKNVEINKFPQLELATKAEEKVHLSPVAVFRNDNVKPCVNIIVNGQLQGHKTSEDQGYESSHNVGAVDE